TALPPPAPSRLSTLPAEKSACIVCRVRASRLVGIRYSRPSSAGSLIGQVPQRAIAGRFRMSVSLPPFLWLPFEANSGSSYLGHGSKGFVEIYTPLLYYWARRMALQQHRRRPGSGGVYQLGAQPAQVSLFVSRPAQARH